MGRPKRLADHDLVQLPWLVYNIESLWDATVHLTDMDPSEKNSCPSYSAMMCYIKYVLLVIPYICGSQALDTSYAHLLLSFELHSNALALHAYTRDRRKKAHGQDDGFDGEIDNFQQPQLSSLVKLVCFYPTNS